MVPVAACGVHSQEHHQEDDYDNADNAAFGHAAAHFSQKGQRWQTKWLKWKLDTLTAAMVWLKE